MGSQQAKPIIGLLPYQNAWVNDASRFKAGMMSRQSGKTFSATLEIVNRVITAASNGIIEHWVILSRGERQAQEALNEGVKKHLATFNCIAKSSSYNWKGADASYKALEVELPNGSKITALPANPDTARGFSRNVLLDEFAFHHDSAKIWAAVFPVVTRGGKLLRVISTPNGQGNQFHSIMTNNNDMWSRHSVDIYQAVEQGLDVNIDELREALNDSEAWSREYELSWISLAASWLSTDIVNLAKDKGAGNPLRYTGGPVFIGNDIGRYHDLWAAVVLEYIDNVYWLRELSTLKDKSFADHDEEMNRLFMQYRPQRIAMDSTGLGMKPVEDAQARYGESIVKPVTFTGPNKLAMAAIAKAIFESNRIRIPDDDFSLIGDLLKIKKTVTAIGAPRFDSVADTDGHADRAWAIFLALFAGENGIIPIDFHSAGDRMASPQAFGETVGIEERTGFGSVPSGYDLGGF
jgi:phage FluMu gp28-like protein